MLCSKKHTCIHLYVNRNISCNTYTIHIHTCTSYIYQWVIFTSNSASGWSIQIFPPICARATQPTGVLNYCLVFNAHIFPKPIPKVQEWDPLGNALPMCYTAEVGVERTPGQRLGGRVGLSRPPQATDSGSSSPAAAQHRSGHGAT